tara:strand:+ start:1786 stop:3126 length:1341 start_codon:yes stop_codon:yes gene_type:complete
MTVVTSKISPVVIGQGRNKETIYTATRTTKMADGTYHVDMLQYSNAQGQGGRVIAERDGVNNWNFNSQASTKVKQNEKQLNSASKNQMESMRGDFVKKSQEAEEYNRAQGEPNKATNDNDGANTRPAPGDNIKKLANATEESSEGTRTQFPKLVHPTGLGKSKQDVIRFDMMEYMPQDFINASSGALGFSNAGRQDFRSRSIGSVTLPIPSGISDQNNADWGSQSMTALDIAKADIALSTLNAAANNTGAGKAFAETGSSYIEFLRRSGNAANVGIANAFAAAAAGVEGQQLLARTTGMVMNPNMELLFKGPTLRPFSFKFTLAPRDKTEAKTIVSIIRFFKQGMAPIRSKSNLFLKTPHTFQLRYLHRGEKEDGGTGLHFKLNAFKECALQSFGVNYTPTGNYATYQDGTMVSYEITMGFSELEPVFNDDYGPGNGSEADDAIGF